jgi:hypothetical protein
MTQPPYQNPYGQPAPYGPPRPKKAPTALIIAGAVLAVLLVAGGALAALLLLSDSDEDDSDKADDTTSSSSSAPAENVLDGNGYTYTLPEHWQDVTADAQGAAGSIDTVAAWGSKLDGGRANVIVETGTAGGEDDPEVLREEWVKNMTGSTGATPQEIAGTTIDGEEAIGSQIERKNESGVEIVQTAYLVVHEGNVYSIALSGKAGDDDAEQAFEDILAGWAWE